MVNLHSSRQCSDIYRQYEKMMRKSTVVCGEFNQWPGKGYTELGLPRYIEIFIFTLLSQYIIVKVLSISQKKKLGAQTLQFLHYQFLFGPSHLTMS